MATNGCLARGPRSCSACASASLPVPLSPSSSTGTCGRRELLDVAADLQHRLVGGDDPLDRRACRHRGKPAVLVLQPMQVETALDDRAQHLELDRLLAEIVGAEADRLQRGPALAVAGDDDHLGLGRDAQYLIQRGHAFATRHPDRAAGRDPGSRPAGCSFCTIAMPDGRAPAITTSQDGKAHRYCERRPSSSSTTSSFGLTAMAMRQAGSAAASATARRTDGSSSRIVVPPGRRLSTSRSPPASRSSSRAW